MGLTIQNIEDALVAALQPLVADKTFKVVQPYRGEWSDLEKLQRGILPHYPGLYIDYDGARYGSSPSDVNMRNMSFGMFLAAQQVREGQAAKIVYAAIEKVNALLHGKRLPDPQNPGTELETLPLRVVRESPLVSTEVVVVYELVYEIAVEYGI